MELRTVRARRRVVFGAGHAVWSLRIDARTNRSIFLSDMGVSTRLVLGIDALQRAPAVCSRFHKAFYALQSCADCPPGSVTFRTSPTPQEKSWRRACALWDRRRHGYASYFRDPVAFMARGKDPRTRRCWVNSVATSRS